MQCEHIEGSGGVWYEADGRVRIVVSDDLADVFDDAARRGVTADDLLNRILEELDRAPDDPRTDSPRPMPTLREPDGLSSSCGRGERRVGMGGAGAGTGSPSGLRSVRSDVEGDRQGTGDDHPPSASVKVRKPRTLIN